MARLFNATKPQTIENMSISDLAKYLEIYIGLQFPESGIDYWSSYPHEKHELLAPNRRGSFSHVACSVHSGPSEGNIIDFRIILSGEEGKSQMITRAKTFGSDEENWAIARAASEVIESLYLNNSLPVLVDFIKALPHRTHNMKGISLQLDMGSTVDSLMHVLIDDHVVASYNFTDKGGAAKHYMEAYHADWKILGANLGMQLLADYIKPSEALDAEEYETTGVAP